MIRTLARSSAGIRAAGCVIALGYLIGLVPAQIFSVFAALLLLTLGRALACDRIRGVCAFLALAVIGLALAVVSLRWGTTSLDGIRGVQAVLGPTVLVEPQEAAAGTILAGSGAAFALMVWLAATQPLGWPGHVASAVEDVVFSLALVTVFWGPAIGADIAFIGALARDVGEWALAVAAVALPAFGLSLLVRRLKYVWWWAVLGVGLAAAVAGLVVVPSVVGG